jgi:putative ABC transport system ATP-binding protein
MIKTTALQFAYPGAAPLHFPDVDVPQGATLLLRGPSGSGKSTWLALVAALGPLRAGYLQAAGQDLAALSRVQADAWRARKLGFLPQTLHLSAALTVAQNLGLAFWAAGVPHDRARVGAVLTALGVAELANRLPAQLSGGQAQRVALARAVLMQPQLVLADEPTASLDDDAANEALQLLHSTAQRYGATLVIATHDARVAHFFAAESAAVADGVHTLQLPRLQRAEVGV